MQMPSYFHRRVILLLIDAVLIVSSYVLAFGLRLGEDALPAVRETAVNTGPVLALISVTVFLWLGVYKTFTRFFGIDSAVKIFKGVTIANLIFLAYMFLIYRLENIPRGVFVINWMANLMVTAGPRVCWRLLIQSRQKKLKGKGVLVYGSVEESEALLREFVKGEVGDYRPVGLVEPDPARHGRQIQGIPVYGGTGAIEDAMGKAQIEEIHFVGKLPDREIVHQFLKAASDRHIGFKIIPTATEAVSGQAMLMQARDLRIEDLLKREPKNLDLKGIRRFIEGRGAP